MEFYMVVFTPVVTLAGSAIGFYRAGRQGKSPHGKPDVDQWLTTSLQPLAYARLERPTPGTLGAVPK
jgi:hypothetical protein